MFYLRINLKSLFKLGCAAGIVSVLWSCQSSKDEAGFYAIDSLVTNQVNDLTAVRARLKKEAMLGDQMDTITWIPSDTSAWIRELDIFRQLKIINKPINRGSYKVEDGLRDPASNLIVKSFTTTDKDLPVRFMRIYYQHSIDKPRKIEASYEEENSLYSSARLLSMEFRQINNKTTLNSYAISGGQKMILGDSVTFFIKGNIFID
jgi:hypothetical protein